MSPVMHVKREALRSWFLVQRKRAAAPGLAAVTMALMLADPSAPVRIDLYGLAADACAAATPFWLGTVSERIRR